jgi:hypothetical protein
MIQKIYSDLGSFEQIKSEIVTPKWKNLSGKNLKEFPLVEPKGE